MRAQVAATAGCTVRAGGVIGGATSAGMVDSSNIGAVNYHQ